MTTDTVASTELPWFRIRIGIGKVSDEVRDAVYCGHMCDQYCSVWEFEFGSMALLILGDITNSISLIALIPILRKAFILRHRAEFKSQGHASRFIGRCLDVTELCFECVNWIRQLFDLLTFQQSYPLRILSYIIPQCSGSGVKIHTFGTYNRILSWSRARIKSRDCRALPRHWRTKSKFWVFLRG
jgi:hypothetical protein